MRPEPSPEPRWWAIASEERRPCVGNRVFCVAEFSKDMEIPTKTWRFLSQKSELTGKVKLKIFIDFPAIFIDFHRFSSNFCWFDLQKTLKNWTAAETPGHPGPGVALRRCGPLVWHLPGRHWNSTIRLHHLAEKQVVRRATNCNTWRFHG